MKTLYDVGIVTKVKDGVKLLGKVRSSLCREPPSSALPPGTPLPCRF